MVLPNGCSQLYVNWSWIKKRWHSSWYVCANVCSSVWTWPSKPLGGRGKSVIIKARKILRCRKPGVCAAQELLQEYFPEVVNHITLSRWQNQIVDVPNKSLINDPTIQLPEMDLPPWPMEPAKQVPIRRGTMPQQHTWVELHRLATLRLRWTQKMRHIVNELACFDGGISELHQAHDAAFTWLLRQHLRSWKQTTTTTSCEFKRIKYKITGLAYLTVWIWNILTMNCAVNYSRHYKSEMQSAHWSRAS